MSKALTTDKSTFDNSWYKPGSFIKRTVWYFINAIFFMNPLFPFRSIKPSLLRMFGAKVGHHCLIKPSVNIKYPWFLEMGDYVTLGERVWVDNLAKVKLGSQVTLSQGVVLITGNHNYKSVSFDLIVKEIHIQEGAWIGANAIVGPGVIVGKNAVLSMGASATKDLDANTIYAAGDPQAVRKRVFEVKPV